jgi:elongation factor 1-beta
MGTALLQIKIMPETPEVNLDEIQEKAEKVILENQGQNPKFEQEPIAFGLKALKVSFAMDESIQTGLFEEKLKEIPSLSSVEITDFRRAFG